MAGAPATFKPSREQAAGARLPYARHLDDATVETRDGRLIQVLHLKGFPFETADTEELNYRKTVRETMLRGVANSRFALYHHIVRREVQPTMAGEVAGDGFAHSLDAAWRARLGTRKLYVNDLFLTLVRRPLGGRVGVLEDIFRLARGASDSQEAAATLAQEISALNAARDGLLSALAPYDARLLTAYSGPQGDCSEPLEFFSLLYNGELRPVRLPDADLGRYLPYRRISFGARAIELAAAGKAERSFAAMVSVKDYPGQTAPGVLDDLMRLPVGDGVDRELRFRRPPADPGSDEPRLASDAGGGRRGDEPAPRPHVAKDDVAAGRSSFGEHHLTVMVKAPTLVSLDQAAADVQSAFTELGVIAVREDINQEAAFWAQFPGNFKDIARRALISSGNFAGLASCHNFPVGQAEGQPLGSGDYDSGDDFGRTVLFQFSSGRPRQLHGHRAVGIRQDRGAGVPFGPGAKGESAHGVLRQGPGRRDLPARHRRQL